MQQMQNEQNYSAEQQQAARYNSPEQMPVDPDVHKPARRLWHSWFRRERRQYRRVRILTWWNLFAVIGVISVVVQLIRYVVVPLLVYLNVLTGGAL